MTDSPSLQQRVAEALMRWAERNNSPQYASMRRPETVRQNAHERAAAVLAELKPELDALAALRAVARGYCPHCGRGDAAPSVTDWERERQRAEAAEAKVADYENRITWHTTCEACARVLDSAIQETERRERVEAALARVREIASELFMGGRTQTEREIGRRLSAALDRGQP
ncbi:hypothetical protein ABZT16_11415 [Streptomyces flaveolus]|uniref:hypothetical protein n=1 Tax=Streptomyces flaveolus TaxID=67297 RepID=UPI0033B24867